VPQPNFQYGKSIFGNPPKKFHHKHSSKKILKKFPKNSPQNSQKVLKNSPKKPKKFTSHLEAENPFGLV
jgi:hypothetical protein